MNIYLFVQTKKNASYFVCVLDLDLNLRRFFLSFVRHIYTNLNSLTKKNAIYAIELGHLCLMRDRIAHLTNSLTYHCRNWKCCHDVRIKRLEEKKTIDHTQQAAQSCQASSSHRWHEKLLNLLTSKPKSVCKIEIRTFWTALSCVCVLVDDIKIIFSVSRVDIEPFGWNETKKQFLRLDEDTTTWYTFFYASHKLTFDFFDMGKRTWQQAKLLDSPCTIPQRIMQVFAKKL